MITLEGYFMGRDKKYPDELSDELRNNAAVTVARANALLGRFGQSRTVSSGWRPLKINQVTPGAGKLSRHITCQAVDLQDYEGDLNDFCMENQAILEELGLWMEHRAATKGWTHVQTVPPKSGKRVFYP